MNTEKNSRYSSQCFDKFENKFSHGATKITKNNILDLKIFLFVTLRLRVRQGFYEIIIFQSACAQRLRVVTRVQGV